MLELGLICVAVLMQILDTLACSCPEHVASKLAAKSWTHRFAHLAVTTSEASVRQAVLQLMANWAFQHGYSLASFSLYAEFRYVRLYRVESSDVVSYAERMALHV